MKIYAEADGLNSGPFLLINKYDYPTPLISAILREEAEDQ